MKLLGKVGIVSAMTGISRVFGLVREMIMARFFGTGTLQSAFVIAFRIPNLFRRLFGEGALGAAFIPIFNEVERTEGRERAQLFLARILGLLVCVLGLLVGIGIAVSYVVQYGCEVDSRWAEAMPLMRIMLPYAVLICLAAIVSAVLNVHDRFSISSLTPVVLNIIWLITLVALCPFLPAEGYWRIGAVCWGILVAGVAQILFQLPALRRIGYTFRLTVTGWRSSPYVRQVLKQMAPASIGIALAQINICMDAILAYYGADWAPAALEYADRIIYLPLGLFGTAFATVLLPTYTRQVAEGDTGALLETCERSLRNLFLLMAPMTAGLIALAVPIVSLIYEGGKFNAQSVIWTASAIVGYAPGLIIFSASKTITPIFYAYKDLKTPVKVASWCILGNFLCNLLSVLFLPVDFRHVGIAGSTVLNSLANTVILLWILRHRGLRPHLLGLLSNLARALLAAAMMGAICLWCYRLLAGVLPLIFNIPIVMALGAATYAPLAALMAPSAFKEMIADLPLRRRKKRHA